jgi:aspartyl-tRNA(Asn)/glutamyl-tRNA(Gln) amidotransferase subunit A
MHSEVFCFMDPSPRVLAIGEPLAGKRVAVQSGISVKGWPTEAGSPALRGFVALEDATVVERLRSAGATLVGNTRMSELGFGLSRDGAGRALMDGHVDSVLMTDTMGEARAAAASAGVFGFKPSYGRISRFGLVGLIPSMDCCSILGRSLEDISTIFTAIRGEDDRDPSMPHLESAPMESSFSAADRPLSAGVVTQCMQTLDSAELTAFRQGLTKLGQACIVLREVSVESFDLFRVVHNVVGSVEASSNCGKFDGVRYGHRAAGSRNWNEMYLQSRAESFGMLLKTYLFQGAYFQFQNYAAFESACRIRSGLLEETQRLCCEVDVLVSPARRAALDPTAAGTLDEIYEAFSLTLPSNVTGQPSLTLPDFAPCDGGDLGLQIVGPLFGDERLLNFARRLSQAAEGAK